jgi:hypothetical protein
MRSHERNPIRQPRRQDPLECHGFPWMTRSRPGRTAAAERSLDIPVKETLYEGVLFRSRTEARHAVFWDELEIGWSYEVERFLPAGARYLPDFVIFPALGTVWVEIKPTWQADPEGVARFREFAAQRPRPSRAALIVGLPTPHNKPLIIGGDDNQDDPVKGGWEDDTREWRPCPGGHHFDLAFPGAFYAKFADDGCPDDFGGDGEARIAAASQAALSHRFGKN